MESYIPMNYLKLYVITWITIIDIILNKKHVTEKNYEETDPP